MALECAKNKNLINFQNNSSPKISVMDSDTCNTSYEFFSKKSRIFGKIDSSSGISLLLIMSADKIFRKYS